MKFHALQLPPARQAGVGLIEVLIALLVLSVGFLGMAALEAMSLSTNNSAFARGMATIASYSILDAMRSDLVNAESGAYNGTVTATSCPTGGSLAKQQLNQWCTYLANNLSASASTAGKVACGNTGLCTITITFDDSRAGNGGATTQFVTSAGL